MKKAIVVALMCLNAVLVVALIVAGILALAFMGFTGMIR